MDACICHASSTSIPLKVCMGWIEVCCVEGQLHYPKCCTYCVSFQKYEVWLLEWDCCDYGFVVNCEFCRLADGHSTGHVCRVLRRYLAAEWARKVIELLCNNWQPQLSLQYLLAFLGAGGWGLYLLNYLRMLVDVFLAVTLSPTLHPKEDRRMLVLNSWLLLAVS